MHSISRMYLCKIHTICKKTRYPKNNNPFLYCSTLVHDALLWAQGWRKIMCALISSIACVYLTQQHCILFNSRTNYMFYIYLPIFFSGICNDDKEGGNNVMKLNICILVWYSWILIPYLLKTLFCKKMLQQWPIHQLCILQYFLHT